MKEEKFDALEQNCRNYNYVMLYFCIMLDFVTCYPIVHVLMFIIIVLLTVETLASSQESMWTTGSVSTQSSQVVM